MLRPIDNGEGREEAGEKLNYYESEDEEDVDLKPEGSSPPPLRTVLPVDQDDEFDLCLDELAEIFADGPISHTKNSKVTEEATVAKGEVDDEDTGGVFVLNDWV